MRVALYWTPEVGDPLAQAGHAWLGRDPEHGASMLQPPIAGIAQATEAPRLYGLHATLRPPMRLATGWQEVMRCAEALARKTAPFDLPPLAVRDFGGFLALRETTPCPALHMLADACVRATDPHRKRPDAAELTKRRAGGLTEEQDALLLRWGYPYVMRHWRFHVTLSGRLPRAEMTRLLAAAEQHFRDALAQTRRMTELAVFTQAEGSPFLVAARLQLEGKKEPKNSCPLGRGFDNRRA